MPAGPDSSDAALRRALAGFADEVGPQVMRDAVRQLGAAQEPGDCLGDYRIRRELGRGGMGIVYEAEQVSVPGRIVAVKVLLGFGGSDTARRRFAREVEVTGQLDHPHIVPILSADLGAALPFYAMKKVDGRSLRDVLRTGELTNDCRRTATMIRDLAHALQHAHEHGVVHRDVKPGNVIIDNEGRAMLLDFGLARVLEDVSDLTRSLDTVGTLDYMAPEQVSPRAGPITARTDVYSLGVTLFECLTGRTPFTTDSRTQTLARIARGDAPRVRALNPMVPRDLENICAMAMHCDAARRYASAGAFAADLEAFLTFRPVTARPAGWLRRLAIVTRRHQSIAVATAAALVVFLVAGAYWAWWVPRRETRARLSHIESDWRRCVAMEQQLVATAAEVETRQRNEDHPGLDARLGPLHVESRRLRLEQNHLFGELETALETCLALDPGHARTNAYFADLLALQLRRLLAGGGIESRRDEIARQQTRLQRLDVAQRHATLLSTSGELSIRCERGPARVWLCPSIEQPDGRVEYVAATDSMAADLGTTPVDRTIGEGNYALRAALAGCEEVIVPVLVRRRAVQSDAERGVDLRPATAAEIGAGFRQVHGGFAVFVAERGDALLQHEELRAIDGFAMTEREVTTDDVIAWLGELPAFLSPPQQGRLLTKLKWPQITHLVHLLNQREQRQATGYHVSLPTPEQWAWAGQGADGRPFPWGWLHDWRFSQNYWSSVDADMALRQDHWPEQDVSPFGVRDLAGSLREVCLPAAPLRELGNKQFLLQGGCYYSFRADDLRLWSSRSLLHDELAVDTGLRLVRRPLPSLPDGPRDLHVRLWSSRSLLHDEMAVDTGLRLVRRPLHSLADRPSAFGDRAGPPDPRSELSGGWRLLGVTGPFSEDLSDRDRARTHDGSLTLDGFGGDFSPHLMAWHAIDRPAVPTTVTASFRFDENCKTSRPLELRLGTRPDLETHDHWVACQLRRESLGLAVGGACAPSNVTRALPQAPGGTAYTVTLAVSESMITVTLSYATSAPIVLQLDRPKDLPATWRYVGVRLPNYIGLKVTVLDLAVEGR